MWRGKAPARPVRDDGWLEKRLAAEMKITKRDRLECLGDLEWACEFIAATLGCDCSVEPMGDGADRYLVTLSCGAPVVEVAAVFQALDAHVPMTLVVALRRHDPFAA